MQQLPLPPLAEGETYIGAIGDAAGNLQHIILLPGDHDEDTWQGAMDWAKSLGGDLPNRVEQAMLYAHHRGEFERDWYWSNTSHEDDDAYAWHQYFTNGDQLTNHKALNSCRARAVRRLPI